MVAHDPLHRSGRAGLPHPAPALGSNAQAYEGIGMADASGWKPPVDVPLHSAPGEMIPLEPRVCHFPHFGHGKESKVFWGTHGARGRETGGPVPGRLEPDG